MQLIFFSAYKEKIGFTGQLLIEPKPKEPTKHQYDYGKDDLLDPNPCMQTVGFHIDAQTVISFLKSYGLDNDYKVCLLLLEE